MDHFIKFWKFKIYFVIFFFPQESTHQKVIDWGVLVPSTHLSKLWLNNLIVTEELDLVQDSIENIRQCIVYLTYSSSWVASFKILYRAYEKRPRIFRPDEPHKWNSTYAILQEVIRYKEVLSTWIMKEMRGTYLEY